MTAGKVKEKHSINHKLTLLVAAAMLPFLCVAAYLLYALLSYGNAYDRVVRNMTMANSYNLSFKEEMDENLYKIVVSGTTFDEIPGSDSLEDPYELLDELQGDFRELESITTDVTSRRWLQNLLRNIDTLRERVDDIRLNLQESGHYDENIEMLDNNIYILTELIQDDIQYYIYYQTQSMEMMRASLNQQVFTFIVCMILLLAALTAFVAIIETRISRSISGPILGLSQVTHEIAQGDFSVRADEKGDRELGALAASVNNMAEHLSVMVMQIREDERKMRKAELRLLQEQINPHFLYNTLDSITWMVEGGKNKDAVIMISELARLLRISLSKGHTIISVEDELLHSRSYMNIQKVRYKERFAVEFCIDPEIHSYCCVKLIFQPILENAIYYGVGNMDEDDGGKITVTGKKEGTDIVILIADNGNGMTEEEAANVLTNNNIVHKHGSGVGLVNVHSRIQLIFGKNYGLKVESEPDCGTTITIRFPAIPFTEENRSLLEQGRIPQKEGGHGDE